MLKFLLFSFFFMHAVAHTCKADWFYSTYSREICMKKIHSIRKVPVKGSLLNLSKLELLSHHVLMR